MVVTFTIKSKSCKSGYRVQALEINSFQFWLLCVFQVICMFWLIFFQRVTGLVDLHIFLNLDPKNWVNEKKVFMFTSFFRITSLQVTKEKHFLLTASLDLYHSPINSTIYSVIVLQITALRDNSLVWGAMFMCNCIHAV